jgi:hypothetical protein
MTREEVEEILTESNPEALFIDGFDDAILGIAERPNFGPIVAYDESKIIDKLMSDFESEATGDDWAQEAYSMAVEYYDYNIKGAWLGEGTPIIISTNFI